jgi:hypothetical protein
MGDDTVNNAALQRPMPRATAGSPPRRGQKGVVLFISLIVLVAMTLAGIAMFRQVGTGVIIAGNLAFRDNASSVSDMGLEAARSWLMASTSLALEADQAPGCGDRADAPAPVYRVLTVLASESARTTYLAEEDGTRRLLTLDVVRTAGIAGRAEPAWLDQRLRALTRWSHPSVPRVIDGRRTVTGDYCVVSHYASGPPLDRYCQARRLDGPRRARLFARVCEAVSDGHRHGVCHGRLRPDLVVVGAAGDEVVPLVLGYSLLPERVPTVEDDLPALELLARAMGWQGQPGRSWRSVDDLLAAASTDWPPPAGRDEGTRG